MTVPEISLLLLYSIVFIYVKMRCNGPKRLSSLHFFFLGSCVRDRHNSNFTRKNISSCVSRVIRKFKSASTCFLLACILGTEGRTLLLEIKNEKNQKISANNKRRLIITDNTTPMDGQYLLHFIRWQILEEENLLMCTVAKGK